MRIDRLSAKQRQIFAFAADNERVLICDGAVRSGKTLAMSVAFVLWAMDRFHGTAFAICGKTVQSAERNILYPLQQVEGLPYAFHYKVSTKMLTVTAGARQNTFYLFGGKDESSYTLIQGLTLAGVLFDEVALMPRSFVEQAMARTISYAGAKLWFNCNPESPNHWFYKEWIAENPKRRKHLHFLMRDNPILGEKEIAYAESTFRGVFYDRYIKGLWVRAEGVVFPDFAADPSGHIIRASELPERFEWCEAGFDIGGNASAYALTCTAYGSDGIYYVLGAEKTQAAGLAMADIERLVCKFYEKMRVGYKARTDVINCDHVAAIVNSLNDNTNLRADLTYKPPLEDRVFVVSKLLAEKRLRFVTDACDALIDEMRELIYDSKADRAIPLDDGSMQIDTWDSFIYSISGHWNALEL